ncbi:hypothetical protein BOTBODRAFT_42706 [Botryobasidium botryosum FD-172 SS1]|uniref:PSP1 C-terminal domain-containing protein n=1 Tax=Botryobasidium botryosum (strain FD-172 SS1) TaxID=930990 RepID=A0A067N050_BOTB1|nr:hypothetical protein BOTBODRAFT_42706 [Botryobasidium botryosum FD-172 SS1]
MQYDDSDRRSRLAFDPSPDREGQGTRERATSQPPRGIAASYSPNTNFAPRRLDTSFADHGVGTGLSGANGRGNNVGGLWTPSRTSSFNAGQSVGVPPGRLVPVRSASFSAPNSAVFPSSVRMDGRSFPSTFEDEEEEESVPFEGFESPYDSKPSNILPARNLPQDGMTRSRSQSLAALPPRSSYSSALPVPGSPGVATNWGESAFLNSISGYNGFGAQYRDPVPSSLDNRRANPLSAIGTRRVPQRHNTTGDISNMSPFVRDVEQILLDEGSTFRELWGSTMSIREDGGGSGATSRRHSVSVVPRRGVSGFDVGNNPGSPPRSANDMFDERVIGTRRDNGFGGSGRLIISDDELASDLNMLSLHLDDERSHGTPRNSAPSQPSSLPVYPSRSLNSAQDRFSPVAGHFPSMNLGIPSPGDFAASLLTRGAYGTSPKPDGSSERTDSPSSPRDAMSRSNQYDLARLGNGWAPDQAQPSRLQQQPYGAGAQNQNIKAPLGRIPPQITTTGYSHAQTKASPAMYGANLAPLSPSYMQGFHSRESSGGPTAPSPQQAYFMGRGPPSDGGSAGLGSHQQQQQQQQQAAPAAPTLSDLGRGVPLHSVPSSFPLFIVEFKAGRTDLYYCADPNLDIRRGDLVIVEADRGKDLGKVINDSITLAEVEAFQRQNAENAFLYAGGHQMDADGNPGGNAGGGGAAGGAAGAGLPGAGKNKEIMPKRIYGKAQPQDTQLLVSKMQDEAKALQLCQSKVRQKKLPMEVVDAEYQWDRRKLTFYFVAERRIDFRELVRELFRLYKTRIWMACLQGPAGAE